MKTILPKRSVQVGTSLEHVQGLILINKPTEAIEAYQTVLNAHPDHLAAALGSALTLPLIYESSEAVQAARERIEAGLQTLQNASARFLDLPSGLRAKYLHWVNFFLAYQGGDDTLFQCGYGDFVAKLTQSFAPVSSPPALRASEQRVRVGFASSYFRQCTVGGYFQRWITHLDRDHFKTYVYHLDPRHDALTRHIAGEVDQFIDLGGGEFARLEAMQRRILADQLDVLIYPELGMDARTFLLASLRLAPVQCAGWGHPVTSGLPSIDYFLSSQSAEPAAAAQHYREQLVLLEGLGVSYPRPECSTTKTRSNFGLPTSKTIYLCPQSLFKLHPDFDTLLARVLDADSQGVLVLFEAENPVLTRCFMSRLGQSFTRYDLDLKQRVIMLPYLPHADYLEVNRLCDVMLDPLYWSGGNTSLDALASGLPVVTFNGQYMRGRQTAAMLNQIGLMRLIAQDETEYVAIAHRLAHDPVWRADARDQLRQRVGELFDQEVAIRSLERFLLQVAPMNA
jgi:CRISPR-associated protein Csy1